MSSGYSGSAFPVPEDWKRESGMTLRDYFAAKAMQSFCVGATGMGSLEMEEIERQFLEVSRFSYLVADAMLKAREA